MIPDFKSDGNLPPGVHWATWGEISDKFGANQWRRDLLRGLRAALEALRIAGCQTVYLDGSFVSSKLVPNDFDACWEEAGMDFTALDPVLLMFDAGRAAQKAKFGGELFPASVPAGPGASIFLEFFQVDKDTGRRKGIIALDLGGLK